MFRTVPLSIISLRAGSGRSDQDGTSWSCSQAVWHIPLLCVQWKTPDDGQRNCPKHVEFYSKNKFEKLVHLVGFIVRKKLSLRFGIQVQVQVQVIAEYLTWVQPISKQTVLTGEITTVFKPTFRWCRDMNSRHWIIVFGCLQRRRRSSFLGLNFRFTSWNMSTLHCFETSGNHYPVTRRLIPVVW